jgi:hypothetical protein
VSDPSSTCRAGHPLRFTAPIAYAGPCCCGPDGDGEEPDCRPCCPTDGDREPSPDPIELACEEYGHAYFRDGADPIHGVCGLCACGSRLYTLTGEVIDNA